MIPPQSKCNRLTNGPPIIEQELGHVVEDKVYTQMITIYHHNWQICVSATWARCTWQMTAIVNKQCRCMIIDHWSTTRTLLYQTAMILSSLPFLILHISFVLLLLLWIVLQGPHLLLPSVSIILSKSSPQETVILKVVSSSTKNIILIIVITYCYIIINISSRDSQQKNIILIIVIPYCYIILYRHNKFIILIAIVNMYSIRYSKRKFTLMTIIFILWLWKRFIIIVF